MSAAEVATEIDQPCAWPSKAHTASSAVIDHRPGQQLVDARLCLRRRRYGASHGVGLDRLAGLRDLPRRPDSTQPVVAAVMRRDRRRVNTPARSRSSHQARPHTDQTPGSSGQEEQGLAGACSNPANACCRKGRLAELIGRRRGDRRRASPNRIPDQQRDGRRRVWLLGHAKRQPGVLARRRGSGRQQAQRRLLEPRQSRAVRRLAHDVWRPATPPVAQVAISASALDRRGRPESSAEQGRRRGPRARCNLADAGLCLPSLVGPAGRAWRDDRPRRRQARLDITAGPDADDRSRGEDALVPACARQEPACGVAWRSAFHGRAARSARRNATLGGREVVRPAQAPTKRPRVFTRRACASDRLRGRGVCELRLGRGRHGARPSRREGAGARACRAPGDHGRVRQRYRR